MIGLNLLTAMALIASAGTNIAVPEVQYTSDSIVKEGVTVECAKDDTLDMYSYTINVDLPFGYVIYNDPTTDYIDGLQVNGKWLDGYTFTTATPDINYTVTVKTVYAENTSGEIAKLLNGNLSSFVNNPLFTLQLVYYLIATISLVIGGFGLYKSKKLKLKSANEIAEAVAKSGDVTLSKLESAAIESANNFKNAAINTIDGKLVPLIQNTTHTNNEILKALALLSTKGDGATLEILDLLRNLTPEQDIIAIIDEAKKSILEAKENTAKTKAENIQVLTDIQTQEVSTNEEPKLEEETKSIY